MLQGSSSSHLIPPLPCVPAQRWLSISGSTAGELGFMSCVLPEDLLVAILSERLQVRVVGANDTFLLQRDRQRGTIQRGGGLYLLLEES